MDIYYFDNTSLSVSDAWSIAPLAAGVSAIAFNITKSCIIP